MTLMELIPCIMRLTRTRTGFPKKKREKNSKLPNSGLKTAATSLSVLHKIFACFIGSKTNRENHNMLSIASREAAFV